jgi:hypothetical protein
MHRRPRPGPVARSLSGYTAGGIHAAPGEQVHANGDAILQKMLSLKKFVKEQRAGGATRGRAWKILLATSSIARWTLVSSVEWHHDVASDSGRPYRAGPRRSG